MWQGKTLAKLGRKFEQFVVSKILSPNMATFTAEGSWPKLLPNLQEHRSDTNLTYRLSHFQYPVTECFKLMNERYNKTVAQQEVDAFKVVAKKQRL